jgi:hypothetical protein
MRDIVTAVPLMTKEKYIAGGKTATGSLVIIPKKTGLRQLKLLWLEISKEE